MNRAGDVVDKDFVSVQPENTAAEAIRVLLDHQISGAPVLDDAGALLGIISEYRLLEVIYDATIKDSLVRDVMTRDVISVEEETPLADLASLFIVHRIRRVPVLRDGRVIGVISRRDLLRYAVGETVASAGGQAAGACVAG